MWSFSVSELAIPGAEIGRISATDADLAENAKLEYTILEGESGDTFNITAVNQEAVITLNKVGRSAAVVVRHCAVQLSSCSSRKRFWKQVCLKTHQCASRSFS